MSKYSELAERLEWAERTPGVGAQAAAALRELEAERGRLRGLLKDAEAVLDPDTDMALVMEIRAALEGE